MIRKQYLLVFTVIAFLSIAISAQVPDKKKVVAGADRAFEKFAKAYVGPAPGCAAPVSLNGDIVFEKAFGLADLEHKELGLAKRPEQPSRSLSTPTRRTSSSVLRRVC